MGLQFHRRHGDDVLALFDADGPGLGDFRRARHVFDADELRCFRQVQGLADTVYHVLRRAQDEQFIGVYLLQRRPHGRCVFGLIEDGPAHGFQAVRLFFGRPAGDDAVVVDEQAVVDDGLDIVVIGDDQGMMALARAAGADKTENLHNLTCFSLGSLLHGRAELLPPWHRR